MGMTEHTHDQPAPPPRRWEHPLDPSSHTGPYRPPHALLDILARVAGVESHAVADTATRARVAVAAAELHGAGLDPRVIGLVAEPRVNELLGVAESTGRSLRGRDAAFPSLVTRGRLWCEADISDYLGYRQKTAKRPKALRSARSGAGRR